MKDPKAPSDKKNFERNFKNPLTKTQICDTIKMFQEGQTKTRKDTAQPNQKGITIMKNSTMNTIVSVLSTVDFEGKDAVMAELNTELHRYDAVKEAKMALYESAHPVVFEVFEQTTTPLTVAEIWEAIEDTVPEGFTKSKLAYALSHQWKDEVKRAFGKVTTYQKV